MKMTSRSHSRSQRGVAVVVVLALVAILMLYMTANLRSLRIMHQEIKLVEQHQLRRWSAVAVATNLPTPPRGAVDNSTPP